MSNRVLADELSRTNPNLSWEKVVSKYQDRGYSGDALHQEIINASQRSRQSVNEALGVSPKNK